MTAIESPSTSNGRQRVRTSIPRTSERTIRRTDLVHRLDRLAPLSIVRALSGMGKTTLVADWARMQQVDRAHVIWLDGKAAEEFSSYLVDALTQVCCIPLPHECPAATRGASGWAGEIAPCLAVLDQRIIVVIDDAHQAIEPRLVVELCELLLHAPQLHLVLCTRVSHPLQELVRSHGLDVTELTGRDLTISADELPAFAEAWGHRLTADQERQLHAVVGGWPSAAQRVLDDTPPANTVLSTGRVRAFLRAVILPQITNEAGLRLAMNLALAEQVDVDLVRTMFIDRPHTPGMLGVLNPEGLLAHFERHGLLEPAPAVGDVPAWRFPTLVRRVLADTFTAQFAENAEHAHRVIAEFLADASPTGAQMGQLLRHARAGGHWSLLERIWSEQSLGLTLMCPDSAITAFRNLPEIIVGEYPVLALAEAVVVCLRHHDVDTDQWSIVRSFVNACWISPEAASLFATRDAHVLGTTATLVARRADGDPHGALDLADELGKVLHTDILAERRSVAPWNVAWFELQWALTALTADRTSRALTLSSRAYASGRSAGADFICAHAASLLALTHAMTGSTRDASAWLETHRGFDGQGQWLHRTVTLPARLAEVLLALDRLDEQAATHMLTSAGDGADAGEIWPQLAWTATQHALVFGEPVATLNHLAHLITVHPDASAQGAAPRLLDRCTADLMLALGELNRAQRFLSDAGAEALLLAVPRARLALIAGDHHAARSIASMHTWDPHTSPRDRVELLMIEAAAAFAMGDDEAAVDVFPRAHILADRLGTLVPYLGIPRMTRESLFQRCGLRLHEAQAARLAAARAIYPDSRTLIVLSPREEVVLHAMVENETLAEIARALTVSIHTVKKQTVSIYAKFGVHDRAAALLHAHRLGLLPAAKRA